MLKQLGLKVVAGCYAALPFVTGAPAPTVEEKAIGSVEVCGKPTPPIGSKGKRAVKACA